jgi:hypothetical protein
MTVLLDNNPHLLKQSLANLEAYERERAARATTYKAKDEEEEEWKDAAARVWVRSDGKSSGDEEDGEHAKGDESDVSDKHHLLCLRGMCSLRFLTTSPSVAAMFCDVTSLYKTTIAISLFILPYIFCAFFFLHLQWVLLSADDMKAKIELMHLKNGTLSCSCVVCARFIDVRVLFFICSLILT